MRGSGARVERGAPRGPGCWPCSRKRGPPQALPLLTRAGGSVGGGEAEHSDQVRELWTQMAWVQVPPLTLTGQVIVGEF